MRPTLAYINLYNLRHNAERARVLSRAPYFMGVVKAQAYGHGAVEVARTIEDIVDYFGVATVEEGIELRKGGIKKPIAILGGFYPGEEEELEKFELEPAVFKDNHVKSLSLAGKRRGKPFKVHIKVDTGLGRLGIPWANPGVFRLEEGIEVVSAFTTLSAADNNGTPSVRDQFQRMVSVAEELRFKERGIMLSVANSAALLLHPEVHADMVRPGIILYGVPPFSAQLREFKPVMKFTSRIVFLKEVPPGTPLGYGGSYVTREFARIATVPVGYDDGIFRSLSNRGWFYVRDSKAPIVGRVSMDLTLLDVSHIEGVKEGDEVVIFSEAEHLWEMSRLIDTIPYEIMCRVGRRVPRIYKGKKA